MLEGALPTRLRRTSLEALSYELLADITAKFDLAADDKRAQAAHIDAIVRARSVDFGEVLRVFQRDELKAICGTSVRGRLARPKMMVSA